ncbi:hypothetical protein F511_07688 [Dorcoceras hygrometricum]|uniref:Uncharacterized protein n=1 Tax=Dorcoceras hygrometricum TaxID=472368 RepID=A0A2Z7CLQ4_9LAMI|nr:hypothetical protein F511_07688 [Dorcoceras hygrometricum]
MTATEEPMLSRINRLDNILKQLEGIRSIDHSPKSSSASTRSSYGQPSSPEGHCRPMDEVIMEVEQKGTLMERLVRAEDRIFKIFLMIEEEMETSSTEKRTPKKGLRQFVKSCVGANVKNQTKE